MTRRPTRGRTSRVQPAQPSASRSTCPDGPFRSPSGLPPRPVRAAAGALLATMHRPRPVPNGFDLLVTDRIEHSRRGLRPGAPQ